MLSRSWPLQSTVTDCCWSRLMKHLQGSGHSVHSATSTPQYSITTAFHSSRAILHTRTQNPFLCGLRRTVWQSCAGDWAGLKSITLYHHDVKGIFPLCKLKFFQGGVWCVCVREAFGERRGAIRVREAKGEDIVLCSTLEV